MADSLSTDRGELLARGQRALRPVDLRQVSQDVSTAEAAAVLGVTERTVRRAIARGEVAASKRGAAYRIDREELARYAAGSGPDAAPQRPLAQVVPFPDPEDDFASLPAPLTSLVGRGAERTALTLLLSDPAVRLVTLTGSGGIGKTRLAIAAAGAARDAFADGVVFVALAAVTDPSGVLPAIADALGLREITGRDRRRQVRAFLKSRRLLLVLDNFEQILAAAPEVAQVLAEAPGLTVLITSRARLRVSGEREARVPPLATPREDATRDELLASAAGQLFLARAREHDPAFTVDDAAARQVSGVCHQLDGLPLAIELAAARVTVLSPRQLRARLERRLPLLTSGPRDLADRHVTLRDAIAWSYDLLSESEQRLFRQLAVFVDGCSVEGAEGVADAAALSGEEGGRGGKRDNSFPPSSPLSPPASPSALDLLASLVEQSLVVREAGPDGDPRFRMLETIREYGLERLQGDEAMVARAAHAAWFCRFAQSWRRLANTQALREPYDRLAADDANLLAALAWLDEHGPIADFASMVASCAIYWYASSRLREAETWLTRALAKQDQASAADRGRLSIAQGELLMLKGQLDEAEDTFAVGLPLMRATGEPYDLGMGLISRGAALNYAGKYAAAEDHLAEALAVAPAVEDRLLSTVVAAGALSNLAVSARGRGELTLATARSEEALRRYQEYGLELAETRTLVDLGDIAKDQGNHRLAAERYVACIERTGERGDMRLIAAALAGIASAATAWGQARTALLLFGAANALRERVSAVMIDPKDGGIAARDLAALHDAVGDPDVSAILREGATLPLAEAVTIAAGVSGRMGVNASARHGDGFDLTRREKQVLDLLGQGLTDREIADALFLSPRTVSWHVGTILGKLGVESRREAMALAHAGDGAGFRP